MSGMLCWFHWHPSTCRYGNQSFDNRQERRGSPGIGGHWDSLRCCLPPCIFWQAESRRETQRHEEELEQCLHHTPLVELMQSIAKDNALMLAETR